MATKLINPCSPCRYGYTGIEQCKVCVNIAKTFGNPIPIPPGHTAKIENNTVIFEPKTAKFKEGDFVFATGDLGDSLLIYSGVDSNVIFQLFIDSGSTYFGGYTNLDLVRLMTDSEKQILLEKLHEAGKDWDAEKCEVVDLAWEPKAGDSIWSINGRGGIFEWTFSGKEEYLPQTVDFRTPELAEAALELLKSAKHY